MNKILDNFRQEMLEDYMLFGSNKKVILFYEDKGENKRFIDYETANTEFLKANDFDSIEEYNSYLLEVKKNKLVPGYKNILYDGESAMIIPIKEAIYVICDMEYEDFPNTLMPIWVNMWINNVSFMELAKAIKMDVNLLREKLEGHMQFRKIEYDAIINILDIAPEEFTRKRSAFYFDDNETEEKNPNLKN